MRIGLSILLAFSACTSADEILMTSHGSLTITNAEATKQWYSQTYMLNEKVIGYSEWMDVKAQSLGVIDGKDYVILMGSTGGNHCQDVVSFIELGSDSIRFSPSFDVCNGLDRVKVVEKTVVLTEIEVEGANEVQFFNLDDELFNGMPNDSVESYSFLSSEK
jgi:hypothetical protein